MPSIKELLTAKEGENVEFQEAFVHIQLKFPIEILH